MMTDEELLERARAALPEGIKTKGTIVRRLGDHLLEGAESLGEHLEVAESLVEPSEDALLEDLEKYLGMDLPRTPDAATNSADVAFHHVSKIGHRTTVVQIRDGQIKRVIRQA